MQLDSSNIQPQNIETPVVSGENNVDRPLGTQVTPEIAAEAIPATPAPVNPAAAAAPMDDAAILASDDINPSDDTAAIPPVAEPQEFDDTVELKGDEQYISAIKKVIQEEAEEPFREEMDSEKLQKGYLKERFGVDVDIEEEAK